MTKEMKALLQLMLAEEEEKEKESARSAVIASAKNGLARSPQDEKAREEATANMSEEEKEAFDAISPLEQSVIRLYSKQIPIWAMYGLTPTQAAKYFNIGYAKIRMLIRKDKYADYLLWMGGKVLIKREAFERFLDRTNSL